MSFGTLLEAARIIEDREAHQAHVPQMRVEPPTWHHHQAVAPMIETIDSADERVVPRSNRADSPKPYARNPETHNEVEKRRRAYLTQCYVELQSVVPSIADCKASNVTVLRSAADYVQVSLLPFRHGADCVVITPGGGWRGRDSFYVSEFHTPFSHCHALRDRARAPWTQNLPSLHRAISNLAMLVSTSQPVCDSTAILVP
mmetsp:Transcript_21672/g.64698  ORF Transcript_21672/g.64698 Transcript_21672/m.64698 type:complete len:201 (+) Transcript_21672:171-773(+)